MDRCRVQSAYNAAQPEVFEDACPAWEGRSQEEGTAINSNWLEDFASKAVVARKSYLTHSDTTNKMHALSRILCSSRNASYCNA
eukprot:346482-Amphidinium_carterae.1